MQHKQRMQFAKELDLSADKFVEYFDQTMALYDVVGTVEYNNIVNSNTDNNCVNCTLKFSNANDATFIRSIIDSKMIVKYNHQVICTTEQSGKELKVTIR